MEKASAWFWGLDAVPEPPSDPPIVDVGELVAASDAGPATLALEPPILVPPPFPVFTPADGETAIVLLDAAGHVRHEIHSHTLILDDPPGLTLSYGGGIYAFVAGADRVYTYQAVA